MTVRKLFDKAYYDQFYMEPSTRAVAPDEFHRLSQFVCAALRYFDQPVKRVLDLGCGLGYWQGVIEQEFPRASYTSVEISGFMCETYGWRKGSAVDFRSRWPFDLVICNDVLQYLDDNDAETAVDNLGSLCRGALYFGALTRQDWRENCDQNRTDGKSYLRTGSWYRQRLARHFITIGGGLYASHRSDIVLYELEHL